MAYDPFAPPPAPGMMSTMGAQTPAVMPGPLPVPPTPLDPNNALAGAVTATAAPGPVMTPGGGGTGAPLQAGQDFSGAPNWQAMWQQFQANPQAFMASLPPQWAPMSMGGAGRFPGFAAMLAGQAQGLPGYGYGQRPSFDRAGYKSAVGDWRDMKPGFNGGGYQAAQGYRGDMSDWRSQRPQRSDFFAVPAAPGATSSPPATIAVGEGIAAAPAAPTAVMPLNPDYLRTGGIGGLGG